MDLVSHINRDRVASIIGIASAIALVYSTLSFVSKKNEPPKGYLEIPEPKSSFPYIGHLLSMGNHPHRVLAQWHRQLGPIVKMKMGVVPIVSLSDPQLAQELFVQKGANASRRALSTFNHYYCSNKSGVLFGNGESWKRARAAVLSVLAPKMIEKYEHKIEFEASDLVERLLQSTESDGSVNPSPDIKMTTFNVISHVTIGKRYDSKDDPQLVAICRVIQHAIKLASFDSDMPHFLPILSFLKYIYDPEKKFRDFVNKERNPIMNELIAEATVSSDINAMKALDSEEFNISPLEKLVILSDMLGGGEDTTETAITWAIAILCNYPQVQKKIQDELDAFISEHGKVPNFSQREQVPYTISAMKECMRFRPITTSGIPHETTKDVVLGRYIIPKGTSVVTSMKAMHENPDLFDDPENFIPERYLNNTKSMHASANGKVSDRDQFNFGWGRRICPGIYLTENELFHVFTHLFSRCTIEPVIDENNKPIYPNIDDEVNNGAVVIPVPYKVKIVERF